VVPGKQKKVKKQKGGCAKTPGNSKGKNGRGTQASARTSGEKESKSLRHKNYANCSDRKSICPGETDREQGGKHRRAEVPHPNIIFKEKKKTEGKGKEE